MGLQFVLGGSGSGKSHYVYGKIVKQAEDMRNYLILVPDQFTMQTQKELCTIKENTKEGIMNIDVLSFSRLSHRIMEELGQENGMLLDDTGKNLVLRKVAGEKKEELNIIGAHLKKTGYIHEVKSMISEFYQYDIGDAELGDLISYAEKKGALSLKLKDLQVLRNAFAEYIQDKYITTEETLERLCRLLPQSKLVQNSVIVLDHYTGFTPIQNKLVRQLMLQSDDMIVTLLADSLEDVAGQTAQEAQKLFYLSHQTYQQLKAMAAEEGIAVAEDVVLSKYIAGEKQDVYRYSQNPELGFLEKSLFRGKGCYQGEVKNLQLLEGETPLEEVQMMLMEIKRLVRTEHYQYRDIAVITGALERYGHLLTTQCSYYQVPLYLDQTRGILFHPLSEFLRSALELIQYDFKQEGVFRYLRTGLTQLSREEIDKLELYINQFGVRGRKSYEQLFVRSGQKSAEEMEQLNVSRQTIVDGLKPLLLVADKKEQEAVKLVEAVYELCVLAKLQEKMEAYRGVFEEQGELARAREYAQVYPAVVDLLDQMHTLLAGETMELSEFAQILEAGLSEITIGTIPQNVDQVVAGDMERTRLKQVKALFFLGVNDGVIPGASKGGGLLSDMEREFLLTAGHELAPTPRQQIFTQRLYLYMNMTKPSEKLYLSYSRVDGEGKSMRKSYLIGMLQKMYPALLVKSGAQINPLFKIASREDGIDDLAELYREYAAGLLEQNPQREEAFFALFSAYQKQDPEGVLTLLKDAAFQNYQSEKLPKEIARALYGEIIESSVGRLEQFSACAYAHFLRYGMHLKEQEAFTLEHTDIGTVFHEVMKLFSGFLQEKGYHWGQFSKEEADAFVEKAVDKLAMEYGASIFYSSASNLAALEDIKGVLKRTIHTLGYQIRQGLFEPKSFEIPFYTGDKIKTKGRIDRIDTFEKDGKVYVKVVDYKTGKNSFDPVELYFGLKMQLAVYMNAAIKLEQKQQENQGKEIVPAALVYYQFQNPVVDLDHETYQQGIGSDGSMQKDFLEDKIHDKMKITGLVSEEDVVLQAMDQGFVQESTVMPVKRKKDGSLTAGSITGSKKQFELLMQYADYKVREVGERVYAGEISIDPYEKEGGDACTYCAYRGVCHFDPKIQGFSKRKLDKLSQEQAWEKMEQEVKHGDTIHNRPAEGH